MPHTIQTLNFDVYEPLLMGRISSDHQTWEMKILHGVKTHIDVDHKRCEKVLLLMLLAELTKPGESLLSEDLRSPPTRLPSPEVYFAVYLIYLCTALLTKKELLSAPPGCFDPCGLTLASTVGYYRLSR